LIETNLFAQIFLLNRVPRFDDINRHIRKTLRQIVFENRVIADDDNIAAEQIGFGKLADFGVFDRFDVFRVKIQLACRQTESVKIATAAAKPSVVSKLRPKLPIKTDLRGVNSTSAIAPSVNLFTSAKTSSATSAADSFFVCVRVAKLLASDRHAKLLPAP
jgi:hypothetical protein